MYGVATGEARFLLYTLTKCKKVGTVKCDSWDSWSSL